MNAASCYVYYKVDAARFDELRQAVTSMFSALEGARGVRGRWLRRRDDPATYMEVYEGVRDSRRFEELLARESEGHGVAAYLAARAARRAEVFVVAE